MIRKDLGRYPFECRSRGAWFCLINYKTKEKFAYSLVGEKSSLVGILGEIIRNKEEDNYLLLGVWNGEYSTDLFDIPIKTCFDKLIDFFS